MKRDKIVIGSRESKLAVLQSEMVRDYKKKKIRIWKWKSSL